MPIIVQAAPSEPAQPVEPLSAEQSQKLSANLAALAPTAEPLKPEVKIDPIPPAPPEPAPAPEPPAQPAAPARAATRTAVRRAPVVRTGRNIVGTSYEQCVPFARALSGVQIRGYAGSIRSEGSTPQVGAVALYRGIGHAAVVTGVSGDSVTIKESNWVPGKITERTVPASALRGYVY